MPTIKEFKQFFIRNTKTTTGSYPDQEVDYPVTISVKGKTKFNRFLKDNFPSEGVLAKLFESITFKLNKEDTASSSVQGLVKKATDIQAESRTLNPDTDFTLGVVPHQLPDIVLSTDGSDSVVGSPVTVGGLTLSAIKRTLTGGRTKRNFLLQVPTFPSIQIKYLRGNFQFDQPTFATVTSAGVDLSVPVEAGQSYIFEILFLFNVDSTSSVKYTIAGTASYTEMQILTDDSQYGFTELITSGPYENSLPAVAPTGNRGITINGSVKINGAGDLTLRVSTVSGNNPGNILKGSYLKVTKIP